MNDTYTNKYGGLHSPSVIHMIWNDMHEEYKSPELARIMVRKYIPLIMHIPDEYQNDELKWDVIRAEPQWLPEIVKPTREMILFCLEKHPMLIQYTNQTLEFCEFVCNINPTWIWSCKIQTEEMALMAVKQHWENLRYVKDKTWRVKKEALKGSIKALKYF